MDGVDFLEEIFRPRAERSLVKSKYIKLIVAPKGNAWVLIVICEVEVAEFWSKLI